MRLQALKPMFAAAIVAIAGCVVHAPAANAADYPTAPTRVIVGFSPGSGPDIVARVLANKLAESLGQAFVVENRVGGSGTISMGAVATAPPDGYTLLFATSAQIAINPSLFPDLKVDPVKDLAPITLAASNPLLLLARPDFPATSARDFIAAAKRTPGKFTYGSAGIGSEHHLGGELLSMRAGIQLLHVPYKSFVLSVTDVINGGVDVSFGGVPPALAFLTSGKLKALAIASNKRYKGLPDVPTFAEQGLPGVEMYAWYGLFAPAGTPKAIIDKLNVEMAKALRQEDVVERFNKLALDIIAAGPEEFAARINSDSRMFAQIIKQAGVKVDK